jgi:hypothetical protein
MRVLAGSGVVLAAAGCGGVSAAQDGRDAMTQPAAYHGPFLSWAGKASTPAAQAPQAQAGPRADEAPSYAPLPPPRPAPAASEFAGWPAPAAPQPQARVEYIAPPQTYTPLARPRPEPVARAAYVATPAPAISQPAPKPLPAAAAYATPLAPTVPSSHRRPAPIPMASVQPAAPAQAAAPVKPQAVAQPAAPAAIQAPPQKLAQNDPAPADAEAPPNPLPPTGVHYYSLHRAYGLTPDKVVVPKDRPMVLIGPAENAAAQGKDDADDNGKSDKHADSADD